MIQWLETAMLAEHEAPREVLETKSLRRRRIGRNFQLLLTVKARGARTVLPPWPMLKACASASS
jgi:hypothetical protein